MNRDDQRYSSAVEGLVAAIESGQPVTMPAWGDHNEWSELVMNLNIQLNTGAEQLAALANMNPSLPYSARLNGNDDLDGSYYSDWDDTGYTVAQTTALGGAVVAISTIAGFAPWIVRWVGGLSLPLGTRMAWSRLPTPVKMVLKALGITEGVDILFDTGPDDSGIVPVPSWVPNIGVFGLDELLGGAIDQLLPGTSRLGQGDEVQIGRETYIVASSWDANGVRFYRFRNGMLGVQNKHGVWKAWRPKKPIVIFASGASDLRDLVRADKAVDKQSGKLAKMLRRRGYSVKKS